jgi:hypothetical protein
MLYTATEIATSILLLFFSATFIWMLWQNRISNIQQSIINVLTVCIYLFAACLYMAIMILFYIVYCIHRHYDWEHMTDMSNYNGISIWYSKFRYLNIKIFHCNIHCDCDWEYSVDLWFWLYIFLFLIFFMLLSRKDIRFIGMRTAILFLVTIISLSFFIFASFQYLHIIGRKILILYPYKFLYKYVLPYWFSFYAGIDVARLYFPLARFVTEHSLHTTAWVVLTLIFILCIWYRHKFYCKIIGTIQLLWTVSFSFFIIPYAYVHGNIVSAVTSVLQPEQVRWYSFHCLLCCAWFVYIDRFWMKVLLINLNA